MIITRIAFKHVYLPRIATIGHMVGNCANNNKRGLKWQIQRFNVIKCQKGVNSLYQKFQILSIGKRKKI